MTFTPGPSPNTVRAADGRVLSAPEGWVLLPPGDAALTRRLKEAGDHWLVQEKKGRNSSPEASDYRTDSGGTGCRTIHRELRQEEASRRPTPREGPGRIRRGFLWGGGHVPGFSWKIR